MSDDEIRVWRNLKAKPVAGVFRWIPGDDLIEYTSDGWKLVPGYQGTEEVVDTQPQRRGMCGPNQVHFVTKNMFLVMKDEESQITKLQKQLEKRHNDLADLRQKRNEAERALKSAQEEVEQQAKQLEERSDRILELENEITRCRDNKMKMEEDIAKIRKELGEKRMREILG